MQNTPNTTGTSLQDTASATPTTISLSEILNFLDDTGLNFVLHTHHPATHLEYDPQAVSTDSWANRRVECPEPPEGIPTGWGARG